MTMSKSKKKTSKGSGKGEKTRSPRFEWPDDSELRFCDALEEYPALWDGDDQGYTNRDQRHASLEALRKHMGYSGGKYS